MEYKILRKREFPLSILIFNDGMLKGFQELLSDIPTNILQYEMVQFVCVGYAKLYV